MVWFWILGAGASIDSGLPVYRGPNGIYKNINDREALTELLDKIKVSKPGHTYTLIKKYSPPNSFILTQNIDGFAYTTDLEIVEIHTSRTNSCEEVTLDNIVLLGEQLPQTKVDRVYRLIKERKPTHVIVLGTSFQFPYLRIFVNKCKNKGAKVFHINPDNNYIGHYIHKYTRDGEYIPTQKYKTEELFRMNATLGIKSFVDFIK